MVASRLRVVGDRVDDNTACLAQAVKCWNDGDLPGYLELYANNARIFGYAAEPMDKTTAAGFYETVWTTLGQEGQRNPALVVHEGAADGDLFACRVTMSGIHRGAFLGVAPTQRFYALHGITMLRFSEGKVVQRWTCEDMFGLLVQLGAIEAPMPDRQFIETD